MGLATVRGGFEDFTGALLLDPKRAERSSVTVLIQTTSLHTGNERRDKHLRSADFFDVEKYPTILFQSERVTRGKQGYVVQGTLTMHGTAKKVAIPFRVRHAVVRDPSGVDYAGYDATIKLNWREYGIPATSANNSWFQPSKMLVNDFVTVNLSLEADRRHPSKIHYPPLDELREVLRTSGMSGVEARLLAAKTEGGDAENRILRALTDLANGLAETGQTIDAIGLLQAAVNGRPGNADALAALAHAYLLAGRRDEALAAYREALRADPTFPVAMEMVRRLERN